ncbi:MAG: MFS transporter [Pseudorhodoplanes sp.]
MTHPPAATKRNFAARLAAFYAAYFILSGIQLPYLPLWLGARGVDAREIGLLLAIPTLTRIAAVPLVSRLSDRHGDLRRALVVLSFAAALAYFALGLAEHFTAILLGMILVSLFGTPTLSVADAYALQGLAPRAYGAVRVWGSVAFVVGNIGAGLLIEPLAATNIVWLVAGAAIAIALASTQLAPLARPAETAAHVPARVGALLRQPAFLAIVCAAALIQGSHALYYAFSAIQWRAAGFSGVSIGLLWATGVLAEIALFVMSARLPPAFGPLPLMLAGAAGATLRWVAMAFDPAGWILYPLQALHGLSFGATYLGTVTYVARAAPPGLAATAQGVYGTIGGISLAAFMLLSGWLYEPHAAGAYAAMAIPAALGGIIVLAVRARASVAD